METLTREQIIDRIQQLDRSEYFIEMKDFLNNADREALDRISAERSELKRYLQTLESVTA